MKALEESTLVPRAVALTLALVFLLSLSLFLSRPTAPQFYQQVWIPSLAEMKAELQAKTDKDIFASAFTGFLKGFSPATLEALKEADNAKINQLPDFWMEHTRVQDWQLFTYFRYDEETCFSDYVGVAGTLVNLNDGCEVEQYRTKGGHA